MVVLHGLPVLLADGLLRLVNGMVFCGNAGQGPPYVAGQRLTGQAVPVTSSVTTSFSEADFVLALSFDTSILKEDMAASMLTAWR